MLLGSAVLSVIVGEYKDAISIAAAVIIVGSVAFFQELKSEETLEALNSLVPVRCNVIRDAAPKNIDAEDLVVGDIIKLSAGDRVPSDCRLITCVSLYVDESSLTGESEPREKSSASLPNAPHDAGSAEKVNMVFMGTLVTAGSGLAITVATAARTEFGKAFQEVKEIESKRTPLQVKMDELGQKLSVFSIGIIVCIGLIGVIKGEKFMDMFNIGVSLAVAAIPEGLPICVTVTLALGVMRMAKRKAVVKRLPAVEALGCADYICCDKTGTLTLNKMTVSAIYCPALEDSFALGDPADVGRRSTKLFEDGYSKASLNTVVAAMYNGHVIELTKFPCLEQLLDAASLCNNSHYTSDSFIGQPTEFALISCARSLGVPDRRPSLERVDEVAFSSDTKTMEVTYNDRGTPRFFVKGALEAIFPRCTSYLALNSEQMAFSKAAQERVHQHAAEMAGEGLRVLCVACGTSKDELTFCGIVGLYDPLRPGIADAVHRIKATGAKVMMITGDSEDTAVSIARRAGIYDSAVSRRVLSGREIEDLARGGDDVLASIIEDVTVCYRTSPHHKLSLVRALQSRGHCVAMTGDGVNDAPALKQADIGTTLLRL